MIIKLKNLEPIKVDSVTLSKISSGKYKSMMIFIKGTDSSFDEVDAMFRTSGVLDSIDVINEAGVTETYTDYTKIVDITRRMTDYSYEINIRLVESSAPDDLIK